MSRQKRHATVFIVGSLLVFVIFCLTKGQVGVPEPGSRLQPQPKLFWPMENALLWEVDPPKGFGKSDKIVLEIREGKFKKERSFGISNASRVTPAEAVKTYKSSAYSIPNWNAAVSFQPIDLNAIKIASRENGQNLRILGRIQAGGVTEGLPLPILPAGSFFGGQWAQNESWHGNELHLLTFLIEHYNGPEPTGATVDGATEFEMDLIWQH